VTVIADTSPIHYAVMIGIADAFFRLYGQILVPLAVYAEMMDPGAPVGLRTWLGENRSRIEVRSVSIANDPALLLLAAGEREAIALAQQFADSLLIIDEKEGRIEAERRGIHVTGLLGVIRDAGIRGYLDFDRAIDHLKATDFRLSPEVESLIRKQFRSSSI
jgi:predicted nucleic acid-binding protein